MTTEWRSRWWHGNGCAGAGPGERPTGVTLASGGDRPKAIV